MWNLLIKPRKALFLLFFLVLLMHAIITTSYASVVQLLTNYAMGKVNWRLSQIILLCLLFAIAAATINVLGGYLKGRVANDSMLGLRRNLFRHFIDAPIEEAQKEAVGSKIAYFTNKLDLVQQNYVDGFLSSISLLFQFIFAIGLGFTLNHRLTLLILLLEIPSLLLPIWARNYLRNVKDPVLKSLEIYTSKITNWLAGFATIKNFGRTTTFIAMHDVAADTVNQTENRDVLIRKMVSGLSQFFGDLVYFGTWIIGAYFILQKRLDMASFLAFTQLSVSISYPVESSADILASFFGGQKAYQDFQQLTVADLPSVTENIPTPLTTTNPFIQYENVTIADHERPILSHINLAIEQTEKIILIGESGAGKSTLVNTLFGYHHLSQGHIKVAGRDLTTTPARYVPSVIGFQDQQTFIFDGTIADNITMFSHDYAPSVLPPILDYVALNTGELSSSAWLQQPIKTHGSYFSGGERQRLGLARNLFADKKFMIFDELSSGLDHATAQQLEHDLFALPNIGFIYITHNYDQNLLALADRVITVKDGAIIVQNNKTSSTD